MRRRALLILTLVLSACTRPYGAGTVMPGLVSGPLSEIRLAIAPDGRTMVWGVVDDEGKLALRASYRTHGRWSEPGPLPLASQKDFDPAFSPDGRYFAFFSDRDGGEGGDDIWIAPFDMRARHFGPPVNAGPAINSAGNEWAASWSRDGRSLLFSSDGRGGSGKQDLFLAPVLGQGFGTARPLDGANGPDDDFDATMLADGSVVMSRGNSADGPVALYRTRPVGGRWSTPTPLSKAANCAAFVIGPSTARSAPGLLFVSARCGAAGAGRMDIVSVPLRDALAGKGARP